MAPLTNIPPIHRRRPRRPMRFQPQPPGHASDWKPRIVSRTPDRATSPLLSADTVQELIAQRIAFLTDEIEHWLPELGEAALLALYEERARWAEWL